MMNPVNIDSRTSIFYQVGFVLARPWQADKTLGVDFQKTMLEQGLDFDQTNFAANRFLLRRTRGGDLQVQIDAPAPQITALYVTMPKPTGDLEVFTQEAQIAANAYQKTWPAPRCQIVRSLAKIHHLYSTSDHAFKILWEQRLKQNPLDLARLGGRPVAGGGLRLVLPPQNKPDEEPNSVELRIESSFQEPKKIFIETAFLWPQPSVLEADEQFSITGRMRQVERFAANEVVDFLTHGLE